MPEKVEVAYADLYKGDTDYHAELVTLRGSMTTAPIGLTGEVYFKTAALANLAAAITIEGETPSKACYKSSENTETKACDDVDPISIPDGELAFFLPGGSYRKTSTPADHHEYLDNTKWWESLAGLSFTSVDLTKTEP